MFRNASDVSDVPMQWYKKGYENVPGVGKPSTLSAATWLLSSSTFAERSLVLRLAPAPLPESVRDLANIAWIKHSMDDEQNSGIAGHDANSCPIDSDCWSPAPEACSLFAHQSLQTFVKASDSAIADINQKLINVCLKHEAITLHVHRIDTNDGTCDFADVVSPNTGLDALARVSAHSSTDVNSASVMQEEDDDDDDDDNSSSSSQSTGSKRTLAVSSANSVAAKRQRQQGADGESRAIAACASLIVVCVDESKVGDTLVNQEMLVDYQKGDNYAKRRLYLCHVLEYLRQYCYFTKRMLTHPLNCEFEPMIPALDRRHGLSLSLFDYQRRSVHWMMRMERSDQSTVEYNREKFKDHVFLPRLRATVVYAPYNQQGSIKLGVGALSTGTFKVHGGMLCAPTGSGKTTCAIALIHLQRHFDRLSSDRRTRRPGDLSARSTHFCSDATLVVAPRQVVQQWVDEFRLTLESACMPRIVVVRDSRQAAKLSMRQLLDDTDPERIDVVIMSKDVFASNNYRSFKLNEAKIKKSAMFSVKSARYRYDSTAPAAAIVRANKNDKSVKPGDYFDAFCAHAIHWRRVIIDETHELDTRWTKVEQAVSTLEADVVWGLTATPNFSDPTAFCGRSKKGGYSRLLKVDDGNYGGNLSGSHSMQTQFIRRAAMTSDVANSQPLTVHRVRVRFTAAETAMYFSLGDQSALERLLYCSHHDAVDRPLVPSAPNNQMQVLTLKEAAAQMCDGYKKRCEQYTASVEKIGDLMDQAWASAGAILSEVDETCQAVATVFAQRDLEDDVDDGDEERKKEDAIRCLSCLCTSMSLVTRSSSERLTKNAVIRRLGGITKPIEDGDDDDDDDDDDDEQVDDDDDDDDENEEEERREAHVGARQRLRQRKTQQEDAAGRLLALIDEISSEERSSMYNLHDRLYTRLKRLESSARLAKEQREKLTEVQGQLNFFNGIFDELSGDDTETFQCPVCMEDANADSLVLTACGHKFCPECARQWFSEGRTKCPMCRKFLKIPGDLREVHRRASNGNDASQAPHDNDVELHGSKLIHLSTLLRQILGQSDNEKVIVFAQFERLLQLVGRTLEALNVGEFVYVRGSIHQCQRSLDRFRSDPTLRIMLLSSETTISGVTLTEANHVIAVHPPFSNEESVEREYSLLWQAIGRVRRIGQQRACHLWSLITEKTLEETMYESQCKLIRERHRDVKFD